MIFLTGIDLQKEFVRLMHDYNEYYWTTAWASSHHSCCDFLLTNRKKIKKLLVGTHFYQTDPQFIRAFIDNPDTRFIIQAEGTYHPKQYLFQKDEKWEMIIGSANFTKAAFAKNIETSILISSADPNSEQIRKDFLNLLNTQWDNGRTFNSDDYTAYLNRYNIMKRFRVNLSDGIDPDKPTATVPVTENRFLNKKWDDYYAEILRIDSGRLEERIRLMNLVHEFFQNVEHFSELMPEQRSIIAGIAKPGWNGQPLDSYLFGYGMWRGLKQIINGNHVSVSEALDKIPLNGEVTRENYIEFMEHYRLADPANGLASPTRLLAMKRPDVFFCITSENSVELFAAMGINELSEMQYWDILIEQLKISVWYNSPEPNDANELAVWQARVAFMDSLFYDNASENASKIIENGNS